MYTYVAKSKALISCEADLHLCFRIYAKDMFSHDETQTFVHMSLVVRKPFFVVSDKVRHKAGCTATDKFETSELETKGLILHVSRQQKTKALNSLPSNARSSDSLFFCIFLLMLLTYPKTRGPVVL